MKLLVIGPQTRAAAAVELLNSAGIKTARQKITETGEGCLHAAAVSDSDVSAAVSLLASNGIAVRSVMEKRR